MPKGTIRNPGTFKSAKKRGNDIMGYGGQQGMNRYDYERTPHGAKRKAQKKAKNANDWDEYRNAGHDTPSLRKSMKDVRSTESVGGTLSTIKENPVKALTRRASDKSRLNKG